MNPRKKEKMTNSMATVAVSNGVGNGRHVENGRSGENGRSRKTRFHKAIERDGIVLMPGCFDALSAAIIQKTGFSAAFISGYAVSAAHLGMPDIGLLTYAPGPAIITRGSFLLHPELVF